MEGWIECPSCGHENEYDVDEGTDIILCVLCEQQIHLPIDDPS
jgi:transcription elongation factor Elf1